MHRLFTVDTELSLAMQRGGASAEENYRSAYLGETDKGSFGIPYQLDCLDRHGLKGVFFVEALHAQLLGDELLKRMVDEIGGRGHDVQLHLHVEWLWFHEGALQLPRKKQHIGDLSYAEQLELLGLGQAALERCGARPTAFRAGNYGANDDTLRALKTLGIGIDSSFNPTMDASKVSLPPETAVPVTHEGVLELPVSWFHDRPGNRRHVQLCAVSHAELAHTMRAAERQGHPVFNIVSHSFELLSRDRTRPHEIVIRRFEKLCETLNAQGGTSVIDDLEMDVVGQTYAAPLRSNLVRTGGRIAMQVLGNRLYERPA